MMVSRELALANSVPATAVIQRMQALFGMCSVVDHAPDNCVIVPGL